MLSRRSLFAKATALAVLSLLSGCGGDAAALLKVALLANSIPPQLIGRFRSLSGGGTKLDFEPQEGLADLFELLQRWHEEDVEAGKSLRPSRKDRAAAEIANLMTLGHYWLPAAVEQELIQPLDLENLALWPQLPPLWQRLVRRNSAGQLDAAGQVWGAPYRWGTTAIAYDRRKFEALGWTPTDWSDLWRPELRDRIAIVNQPREVIGLTLKKLGYSYNTADLSRIPNLKSELLALHQQVKFYSSTAYLHPLVVEDAWVAVGWSTDIVPLQKRYPQLASTIPLSGTALWADLWVQPSSRSVASPPSIVLQRRQQAAIDQWIDFCWQKNAALEISLWSDALSPMLLNWPLAELPKSLRNNPAIAQGRIIADRSESIEPLPPEATQQYEALWREVRQKQRWATGDR